MIVSQIVRWRINLHDIGISLSQNCKHETDRNASTNCMFFLDPWIHKLLGCDDESFCLLISRRVFTIIKNKNLSEVMDKHDEQDISEISLPNLKKNCYEKARRI